MGVFCMRLPFGMQCLHAVYIGGFNAKLEKNPPCPHQFGSEMQFGRKLGCNPISTLHAKNLRMADIAADLTNPPCPLQKLEGSKCRGQLLIFGATNWDLIGRKEVPKQQGEQNAVHLHCQTSSNTTTTTPKHFMLCILFLFLFVFFPPAAYRNLGQNLWGPHRYGCLSGIQVRSVVSGPCAAHSLLITAEGKLWSWGEQSTKTPLGKTCKTLQCGLIPNDSHRS